MRIGRDSERSYADGRSSLISAPSPFTMISRLPENRSQVVRIVADMLHTHRDGSRSSGDSFEENMYWLLETQPAREEGMG